MRIELRSGFQRNCYMFIDILISRLLNDNVSPHSHFRDEGKLPNMMLAQSFAKNMGLYGQRVGVVSIDCNSKVFYIENLK